MGKLKKLYGTELLEKLSLIFGPSGCEDNVAKAILETCEGAYDERVFDNMGSVILKISKRKEPKNGAKAPKKLMFSSHMDEVGFMVSHITDDGYLKPLFLSGADTRVWKGRNIVVGDEKGTIKGYMGTKPIHFIKKEDRTKAAPADEMYIDIGAKSKEEAEKYVAVGSYGTWDSDFYRFGKDGRMLKGKALDDRLGCAIMCDLAREIYKMKDTLTFDIYFAFTRKEELGLSGARCAAYKIAPDYAMIFETTAVADIDGVPEHRKVAIQGEGGALSIADRATIYDKEFTDFIKKCAAEKNIPIQYKKYVSGGNDAGGIHKTRTGIKCAALSAPSRYIHTASNVVRESDFINMYETALETVKRLTEGGIA
ncbi:MAG: M42 family metallopeptidase [Ruminococcaceae bacterium]|nr:M42 family metallopeptidase [Oscillospiraceae bacterium]